MPVVNGRRSGRHPDGHDDLLERRVAGPLADAVDRALDLPRAGAQRRQRVRRRQPEIVVAVRAERHLVGARHPIDDRREEVADLVRASR